MIPGEKSSFWVWSVFFWGCHSNSEILINFRGRNKTSFIYYWPHCLPGRAASWDFNQIRHLTTLVICLKIMSEERRSSRCQTQISFAEWDRKIESKFHEIRIFLGFKKATIKVFTSWSAYKGKKCSTKSFYLNYRRLYKIMTESLTRSTPRVINLMAHL